MKTIEVVAAVILHEDKIFATQRGYGDFEGGWEFPGGKMEAGETPQQALVREIMEELDTEIEVGDIITIVEGIRYRLPPEQFPPPPSTAPWTGTGFRTCGTPAGAAPHWSGPPGSGQSYSRQKADRRTRRRPQPRPPRRPPPAIHQAPPESCRESAESL